MPETRDASKEIALQGIGVTNGVAVGPAFLLASDDDPVTEREITPAEIPREIARFEDALIATRKQLHDIQRQVGEKIGQENASIFDAHLLVVDDRALVEEVIRGLAVQLKNAEAVLRVVADKYANALASVADDYLRERAVDVRDVTRRILRNLAGRGGETLARLGQPSVLIARDLAPSDTAALNREQIIGFATDLGSPTSHTAIMARALGIPAIVGLHDVTARVRNGDTILIDAGRGVLLINPTQESREKFGRDEASRASIRSELAALRAQPAETRDGYRVVLSANIELPGDVPHVFEQGANGVGLFRTEYLYLSRQALPTEDEQAAIYSEVAEKLKPAHAIIRTLDLGGDKFVSHLKTPAELNPFMGCRAIRFCLAQPDIFKTQLRAILRASVRHNIKIMYPMISNLDEVLRANAMLDECKLELRASGIPFNADVEVGVMIEVPSAALTADLIAPHVSFFSLGTNDLVQYTLAVDRVNERIAHLYEPTHPAILKLIKNTIDIGHEHGIWTGICGEMAGNPLMAPLLVGLGVDELSVSPPAAPAVKDVIRKMTFSQAERLAQIALASENGGAVTDLCRKFVREVAPEVLALTE